MENSPLSHSMSRLSFELNGSGSSGSIVPESRSAKLERGLSGVSSDDELITIASRLQPRAAEPHELSPGELAGVIVAALLVTAALVGVAVWMHVRRKKRKNQEIGHMNGGPNSHHPVAPQVSVISMDARPVAMRQNSNGYGSTNGSLGHYRLSGVSVDGVDPDDEMGSFTDYGSVVGSFPPSPTPSFRSAIDAPGFSRSRAGTGTSFATVASFGSYRSRVSNTASFHTCLEEEFS